MFLQCFLQHCEDALRLKLGEEKFNDLDNQSMHWATQSAQWSIVENILDKVSNEVINEAIEDYLKKPSVKDEA